MAQALIRIALDTEPQMTIATQIFPEENALTTILKKLGFSSLPNWRITKMVKSGNVN